MIHRIDKVYIYDSLFFESFAIKEDFILSTQRTKLLLNMHADARYILCAAVECFFNLSDGKLYTFLR